MKTTVESRSASNYIIRVVVARDAAMAPKHEDSGRIGTACQFRLTFLDSGELYLHFYDRYWKPLGKKEGLPGLGEYTCWWEPRCSVSCNSSARGLRPRLESVRIV